jgi:hypothetical protein
MIFTEPVILSPCAVYSSWQPTDYYSRLSRAQDPYPNPVPLVAVEVNAYKGTVSCHVVFHAWRCNRKKLLLVVLRWPDDPLHFSSYLQIVPTEQWA